MSSNGACRTNEFATDAFGTATTEATWSIISAALASPRDRDGPPDEERDGVAVDGIAVEFMTTLDHFKYA
jgi:hypothetical protein